MGSIDRRAFLGAATAAVALPLAGCGGGGDGADLPPAERLESPTASTPDGPLYRTIPNQHALVITDRQGRSKRVGGVGRNRGKLNYPVDLAVIDNKGYVVEVGNHRVQIFDSTGTSTGVFGEGELNYPGGISNTATEVLVADSRNARIAIFTHQGVFLRAVGVGVLSAPRGVVALEDGIVVADPGLRKVVKFTWDGRLIGDFGGKWILPWDVATNGRAICVADHAYSEVVVLDITGKRVGAIPQPAAATFLSFDGDELLVA